MYDICQTLNYCKILSGARDMMIEPFIRASPKSTNQGFSPLEKGTVLNEQSHYNWPDRLCQDINTYILQNDIR